MADASVTHATTIRDADLIARVNEAKGFLAEIVRRQCEDEQAKRDAVSALPIGSRRRIQTRAALEETGNARENLRHIHSVLAICSLPYTAQPITVREWNRTQGKMSLSVTAGKLISPDEGKWVDQPLPYGSRARLLLLHTCSEAIRQNSPVVEIEDSLSGFIRSMGFAVTGGKHGSLTSFKQQINALAACTMRIGVWDGERAKTINTQPFTSIDVWFPTSADQRMLWPSTITFSQEFYTTLARHALPINVHAVRAFSNSPRKLDLLFWLGYRLNSLSKPLHIPWETLREQWGAGYARPSDFRRDFAKEISELKEVFPKLPVKLTDEGCNISPGSSEVLAIPTKTRK